MINTYREYIEYFNLIGLSLPGLAVQEDGAGMVFWDPDRKLARQRSVTNYPLLEVQRPTLSLTLIEGGDQYRTYRASFSVLEECQVDDEVGQEEVLDKLEAVMEQVVERLWLDDLIENEIIEIVPIRNAELDNLWGWGAEFQVKLEASLCYDQEEWLPAIQLRPEWQEGESNLGLIINGETVSTPWTTQADLSKALAVLRDLVNGNANIMASLQVMNNTVFLVADDVDDPLLLLFPAGHTWATLHAWL